MALKSYDLARDSYAYTSDDTGVYQVGSSKGNGDANSASHVDVGVNDVYPRGWVMRKVYGKTSTGARAVMPVFDPGNGIWVGGATTFTKNGVTYDIEGRIGERRTNKGT